MNILQKKLLYFILFFIATIVLVFFIYEKLSKYEVKNNSFLDSYDYTELITHKGNVLNKSDFIGIESVLFFGFTFCPDICPMTLNKITEFINTLDTESNKLKFYFITVDPDRDTVNVIDDYLNSFSEQIIGVTGNKLAINKFLKGLHVYHKKIIIDNNFDDYTVDHTSSILLIDNKGDLFATISYNEDKEISIEKLKKLTNRSY